MTWGSRSLGGTDVDKIDCGSSATLNPTAITFVCWAYATSFSHAYNVITKRQGPAGATLGYAFQPKSTGKIALYLNNTAGTGSNYDGTGTNTLSTNTWYHLAFIIPSTATAATGYVNGVLDGTASATSGGSQTTSSANTTIGWDQQTANSGWAGRLADCAYYNVALTTTELLALAKGARPNTIRPTALVGYYPLDGLQSPEEDLSGNKNNGTLTGTVPAFGPPYAPLTPRWPQFLPSILLPPQTPWGSRNFNGTSDTISAATITSLTRPLTMSCWVYPITLSGTGSHYVIFNGNTGSNGSGIQAKRTTSIANGDWCFMVPGTVAGFFDCGVNLTLNAWSNCIVTYDSSNNFIAYTNGAQTATGNTGGTFVAPSGGNFIMGNLSNENLADAACWNVLLTASEAKAISQGARPNTIRPANLVAWWPLDGLQSPEEDLSGKANNGTLTGTTPAFGPPYAPMTPRWPRSIDAVAAPTFNPAWARGKNTVIEGVAT